MSQLQVDLFTEDEHGVIAAWLGTKPLCQLDEKWFVDDALMRLGFQTDAPDRSREQAAVASIVLEGIQNQLSMLQLIQPMSCLLNNLVE